MQLEKSEEYAMLLVENLNHQVFLQFVIPTFLEYGKIQLRKKEQFERMDKIVRSTLHSFRIDMVNIYDMNNIISYSFDREMVGKKDLGGKSYKDAIQGRTSSSLVYSEEEEPDFFKRLGFFLGLPHKSKIVTFAPLRVERQLLRISGPVLGVVEIVQDLSEDYNAIFRFQTRVIITSTLVMGGLFLVLFFVVRRGERIIHKRNLERIRLKEELGRAQRLSSLGEMVAGVSHEIRNPLGIIRSSAELLKKKMLRSDPTNSIPDIIVQEASRLNDIITDFLNFARPREPKLAPCRVDEILEKNISFLASQIEEGGYAVETEHHDRVPDIMADADMLYQAFLNLLINAMQAMPEGGNIRIETETADDHLRILFKDEGEGISQEAAGKIWEPFFTTKEKGVGLGLGIVKNIIESHGGGIRIENRPERGAQVIVEVRSEK